ncbi:conserved hypothetical protein [Candida dubliniensis CD36]|uniref:Uncharacterized protein n=1 Tax=Candida dubliniensis (strain CD36 / ATCC MYA-646 / CBS 7987 / NCPF 3949 / NRRL Y-17841) TaxID=573826 RepID=B9WL39_CANDC|nr:conserved hypothetical protein [Candida dubliniensis CD36]CAX39743.1 conserved hypothetical protein [Candida dubliniensis CD36]
MHMTKNSKKHSRSDDDEDDNLRDHSGKRVKLDSLLKNLSLEDQENENRYIINPKITYENIFSKSGSRYSTLTESQLASNLNEKLTRSFKNSLESGLRLILWYNAKFLIMYRYQKWFVKLFNRFIKKYNEKNRVSISTFHSFTEIMKLVRDRLITLKDLANIIDQENQLEIKRLELKQEMRRSEKRFEEVTAEQDAYQDLKYNYWDNLKFDKDLDMLDVSDCEPDNSKFEELDNDDTVMEQDL